MKFDTKNLCTSNTFVVLPGYLISLTVQNGRRLVIEDYWKVTLFENQVEYNYVEKLDVLRTHTPCTCTCNNSYNVAHHNSRYICKSSLFPTTVMNIIMKGLTDWKMVDFSKLIIRKFRDHRYCELYQLLQGMQLCIRSYMTLYFLADCVQKMFKVF